MFSIYSGENICTKGVTVDYFRILYPLSCFSPEGNLIKDNKGKKRSIRPNPFVQWSKVFIHFILFVNNKEQRKWQQGPHTPGPLLFSLIFISVRIQGYNI